MLEGLPTDDPTQPTIVAACDALKRLADHLAQLRASDEIEAETVTQQILARQAVFVLRQTHAIAFLVAWPFYAEQAGQLVRGLTEITRFIMWLDGPEEDAARNKRALIYWKDGVRQMRDKYEYQETIGQEIRSEEWVLLEHNEKLIAEQEATLGLTVGGLPDARQMWEGLEREELYGLFRWESDTAHGSSIALGTVVRSSSETHFDLGGPNKPKDRARRLGAALLLLQLSGTIIVEQLGFDVESWQAESSRTEAEMESLLLGLL